MTSRIWIAVLLLATGAAGGACMYGRQNDKSIQDDYVEISRLPAAERQFEEINRIIYGVQSADQVRPAIEAIVAKADSQPDNDAAKVYAAILRPALKMEGIVYRLRYLAERIDVLYIQSISALRAFKRNKERRGAHVDAFFDYLTTPNPDQDIGGQKGPFKAVYRFQDWMAGVVAPDIRKGLEDLRAVAAKYERTPQKPVFYYDIALLIGEGAAAGAIQENQTGRRGPAMSQTRRMRKVVAGDLWVLIADMEERMGIGHYLAAYDLEDLPRFMNSLTKKTLAAKYAAFVAPGETAFNIHLQSPREFHNELFRNINPRDELAAVVNARKGHRLTTLLEARGARKAHTKAYADFLTLRKQGRDWYLSEAHGHIVKAIDARAKALSFMDKTALTANRQDYFLDPDLYTSRPGFTANILNKRKRELAGETDFVDRVTGQSFKLNVRAIFDTTKIPQDPSQPGIHDLKTFFPDAFGAGEERTQGDTDHFAWNYEYGEATGWPDPTFGQVLPGTSDAEFPVKLAALSRDASTRVLQMWLRIFML